MDDSNVGKSPPWSDSVRSVQPNWSGQSQSRPHPRPALPPRATSGGALSEKRSAAGSRFLSVAMRKKLRYWAVVAMGSLAAVVIAGLLSVVKTDEDRLARLEAQQRSRGNDAGAAAKQSPPASLAKESLASSSASLNSSSVTAVDFPQSEPAAVRSATPVLSEPTGPAREPTGLLAQQKPAQQEIAVAARPESAPKHEPAAKPEPGEAPTALAAWRLPEPPASAARTKTSWFAVAGANADSDETSAPVCSADRSLHTALVWSKSPEEASDLARREGKLVFVIHVSGNFEDPGFT